MAKIYRNKAGKKLYPVCKWEDNQHKLYNAHDRIWCAIYDDRENGGEKEVELYEALEKLEKVMEAFEAHVIDGLVYATYEDSCLIKDYVAAYDIRH